MKSRALLLLEKAAFKLQKQKQRLHPDSPYWGISLHPVNENYFEWEAEIEGLVGTNFEGGVFKLGLYFDDTYDIRPPQVYFITIPFHPNIDIHTGRVCTSFLDDLDHWNPNIGLLDILLSMQVLLGEACLENPINISAAHVVSTFPHLYSQLCRDCAIASKRVKLGLPPYIDAKEEEEEKGSEIIHRPPANPSVKSISFREYYFSWRDLATSKQSEEPFCLGKNTLSRNNQILRTPRVLVDRVDINLLAKEQHHLVYGRKITRGKSSVYLFRKERLKKIRKGYEFDATDEDLEGDGPRTRPSSVRTTPKQPSSAQRQLEEGESANAQISESVQSPQQLSSSFQDTLDKVSSAATSLEKLDLTVWSEKRPSSILSKPATASSKQTVKTQSPRKNSTGNSRMKTAEKSLSAEREVEKEDNVEPWEDEVEELVQWTSKLDVNHIDEIQPLD